ncbi:LPS translocon maturation chaperone LptM [Legionella sp. WA2024007413]
MKRTYFLLMICLVIFLSACGQKGPLYLPHPTSRTADKSTQ